MNKINITVLLISNLIFSTSYYQEIQPILNQNCTECHIGALASGGLDLTSYDNLMNGGNGGQVIVSGNHQESSLWQYTDVGAMPPYGLPLLDQQEIDLIASWIDLGARECDDGFAHHPEVADALTTDYLNINIQDQEYNACFYEQDLEVLESIIEENNFETISDIFKVGTQTWNGGRLRFLVAGHYFNGVYPDIIHTIPENFGQLDDLRSLYLEWNQIQNLPNSFSNLTKLVGLYISNNQLTTMPENLGNLENLYTLDLGYNQITSIPESILELDILTYLWIFNNQIMELPNNFCDLDLNWSENDPFYYPYFASGGNMLCENIPECVLNSDHFNISLEQYYYSAQVIDEQECDWLTINDNMQNLEFSINNIYPNPFNPITNINFTVNNVEMISIYIYDLKGNLIETLIENKMMESGIHNIMWNPALLPSGMYFVNISNGMESKTQKIILQK